MITNHVLQPCYIVVVQSNVDVNKINRLLQFCGSWIGRSWIMHHCCFAAKNILREKGKKNARKFNHQDMMKQQLKVINQKANKMWKVHQRASKLGFLIAEQVSLQPFQWDKQFANSLAFVKFLFSMAWPFVSTCWLVSNYAEVGQVFSNSTEKLDIQIEKTQNEQKWMSSNNNNMKESWFFSLTRLKSPTSTGFNWTYISFWLFYSPHQNQTYTLLRNGINILNSIVSTTCNSVENRNTYIIDNKILYRVTKKVNQE